MSLVAEVNPAGFSFEDDGLWPMFASLGKFDAVTHLVGRKVEKAFVLFRTCDGWVRENPEIPVGSCMSLVPPLPRVGLAQRAVS